ncbi:MAG TPA: RNA pseudouridine synthase [Myxococcota bacterium]|nr:RNA pseudouridine synthase [Myxococcota bacterium]
MQLNPLIVLSEGPHHIAVYKPHNIATVGGRGVVRPTLLDLVRKLFGSQVYPVHRLDRVTAGITIFARSLFAKHALENAFKKRLVKKIYYALCEGTPSFSKTTVTQSLKKVALESKKGPLTRQSVDQSGQQAITILHFLKQYGPYCLIEAQPLSGRFHQIRIHLAELSLPIIGDKLYGAKTMLAPHTIALAAVKISLPLPKRGRLDIDATKYFDVKNYI